MKKSPVLEIQPYTIDNYSLNNYVMITQIIDMSGQRTHDTLCNVKHLQYYVTYSVSHVLISTYIYKINFATSHKNIYNINSSIKKFTDFKTEFMKSVSFVHHFFYLLIFSAI